MMKMIITTSWIRKADHSLVPHLHPQSSHLVIIMMMMLMIIMVMMIKIMIKMRQMVMMQ